MPINYKEAKVIKAPEPLPFQRVINSRGDRVVPASVFLAGSIEMGKAVDWQKEVTNEVSTYMSYIFNPRRDDWDSTWQQSMYNEQFNTQVSWEMAALDIAQVIFMYFAPETKSPISLLELGMYASSGKMIVCCPMEFWRRGNVEMVCWRFGVPLYSDLRDAIPQIRKEIYPGLKG
jgi:hypothetical protein